MPYLTKAQEKAIYFLIALLCLSALYRQLHLFLNPRPAYDFSAADSQFYRQLDSVRAIYKQDSLAKALSAAQPLLTSQLQPAVQTQKSAIKKAININTASVDDLTTLPRIGAKTAARIIEYRNKQGPFVVKRDLLKIKGIGGKTLERLRPLIRLE